MSLWLNFRADLDCLGKKNQMMIIGIFRTHENEIGRVNNLRVVGFQGLGSIVQLKIDSVLVFGKYQLTNLAFVCGTEYRIKFSNFPLGLNLILLFLFVKRLKKYEKKKDLKTNRFVHRKQVCAQLCAVVFTFLVLKLNFLILTISDPRLKRK